MTYPNGLRIAVDCNKYCIPYALITSRDPYSDNEYLWVGRLAETAGINIVGREAYSLQHKKTKNWWTAWCILERALWHHCKIRFF